jgi:hypothetical protein
MYILAFQTNNMIKKIALCFICISSLQVFSQSFYKGALVFDLNTGIDVYGLKFSYKTKNINPPKDTSTVGAAASSNFNFGLEYGLNNWFGLGIKAKFDKYIAGKDSATHSAPTIRGIELAAVANAHVLRLHHFDLPLGIDLGYSNLNYHLNDVGNNQIYGNGSYFNFHINPRFYIRRFGFNLNFAVPVITYSSLTSNNVTFNKYILADWKAAGISLGVGIQYRFLSAK